MEKLNNVPMLRFPEFSDTWLSEQFNETVDAKSSKYNPLKGTKAIKCIELEHLSSETGELLGYTDGQHSGSIKNVFHKGDVLFGKLRPYLRKYLLAPFDGVCSSEIWVLKSKHGINSFLYYIVQSDAFIDLTSISTGSKMPRADWNVVSNGVFHYPSLPEQQKIASFLIAVDDKIQQLSKKKALLEQYKKGVMQQLFSQKLRFKDDQGNEFEDIWEADTVGSLVDFLSGFPFDGEDITEDNDGIPLMRGTNITEGRIRHGSNIDRYYKGSLDKLSKYLLNEADIVIGMDGSKVGKNSASVSENDAGTLLVQRVARLRGIPGASLNFVYQHINSSRFHSYVDKVKTSSGIPHISAKQIKEYAIIRPGLQEQQKIANFLSAIDDKINGVAQQIEQTRQFKKGLLQQMFV